MLGWLEGRREGWSFSLPFSNEEQAMKAAEIKVGGLYWANVSGKKVRVRVDDIHQRRGAYLSGRRLKAQTQYAVTNLATNRTLVFRSAKRFLDSVADAEAAHQREMP
jgi:hypothetical protein